MFKINDRTIGRDYAPYIIAELSANHGGSIESAKLAITIAKENGASAVKIQTYEAGTMTLNANNRHFLIDDKSL